MSSREVSRATTREPATWHEVRRRCAHATNRRPAPAGGTSTWPRRALPVPPQETGRHRGESSDAGRKGEHGRHHEGDGDCDAALTRDRRRHLPGPALPAQCGSEAEHSDTLGPLPQMQIQDLLAAGRELQASDERG